MDGDRQYQRAARIIDRIGAGGSPRLGELAQAESVSPFHAQRSFSRYAGLSPQRFAAFADVCRAKGLLLASRSVLDVALDLELSGPGRLHDRFIAVEAVSPGEFASGGEGLQLAWGIGATPIGPASIAWTARGISRLQFVEDESGEETALRRAWPEARIARDDAEAARLLARAFDPAAPPGAGRSPETKASSPAEPTMEPSAPARPGCDLRLLLRGTPFQVAVWRALLTIPDGAVTTYARIAELVDRPSATRAVGTAIGDNPIAMLIPCHRVIRSTGLLGGYRWGLERKTAILAREVAKTRCDLRSR